jgi:ferredoxin-type protein NapG
VELVEIKPVTSGLTRRMFIGLVGNAALLVGLGGLVRVFGGKETFLRPPGAVAEQDFLAACVKCQTCAEVCPTGVITQGILAQNLLGIGTPRLNFGLGYCTLCLKCIQACPTGALHAEPGQKVVIGVAEINPSNCIAWNWGGCTKCHQVCPNSAITLDSTDRPVVDPIRCTGCGQCEYECPSSSLRSGTETGGKGIRVIPLDTERPRLARRLVFPFKGTSSRSQRQGI